MKSRRHGVALLGLCGLLLACSPARAPGSSSEGGAEVNPPGTPRTLMAAVRVEPATVGIRTFVQAGVALFLSKRLFNAELAILDPGGNPRPYLAESLPQLNTDDWRVLPDGRMETTHRLKPDLLWHDGTSLTTADFVFAWRVYTTPELGQSNSPPFNSIGEVLAPDERTLVIRWRRPYPDASALIERDREFPPLPRHLLEPALAAGDPDGFINNPFWTRDYVGLGPYRLARWEPGTSIEAAAFDRYVLGRPKIERIRITFISDSNTTLAHLLSGEIQLSADSALDVELVPTLRREWGSSGGGAVLHPNSWRSTVFQLRPEFATPSAILDRRVRKALAHAVDKSAINEAVYDGNSAPVDFLIPAISAFGPAIDRAIPKYPDLRRSEQLMNEAGFAKAADGAYINPAEGRLVVELKTNASADNLSEQTVLASEWRRVGIDIQEAVLPAALAQDNQARATFPGMFTFNTGVGVPALLNQTSERIPRAENRWQGGNRGAWSNPDYDRLADAFNTTLDRTERERQVVEMAMIYTNELPAISLFLRTQPWVYAATLTGPQLVAPEANMAWNIHEWQLR